jgi:hypothetical protein
MGSPSTGGSRVERHAESSTTKETTLCAPQRLSVWSDTVLNSLAHFKKARRLSPPGTTLGLSNTFTPPSVTANTQALITTRVRQQSWRCMCRRHGRCRDNDSSGKLPARTQLRLGSAAQPENELPLGPGHRRNSARGLPIPTDPALLARRFQSLRDRMYFIVPPC